MGGSGENMVGRISIMAAAISFVATAGASAQDAASEKLSRDCNRIYIGLCKDIKRGPEMLGKCFEKHPAMDKKIPSRCTVDFQSNIEGYNDAKSQR
jgi:hypothetical protein